MYFKRASVETKMTEIFSPSELTLCSQQVCQADEAGEGESAARCAAKQSADVSDPKKVVEKIIETEETVAERLKNDD